MGGYLVLFVIVLCEVGVKVEYDVFYFDLVSGEEVGKCFWVVCCF